MARKTIKDLEELNRQLSRNWQELQDKYIALLTERNALAKQVEEAEAKYRDLDTRYDTLQSQAEEVGEQLGESEAGVADLYSIVEQHVGRFLALGSIIEAMDEGDLYEAKFIPALRAILEHVEQVTAAQWAEIVAALAEYVGSGE